MYVKVVLTFVGNYLSTMRTTYLIFNIFFQVSNMVMQLLHSIKYSVEVPFSNIAQQPSEITKMNSTKKVREWVESESEPVFFTYSVSYSIYLLLPKLLLLIHKIFQSIIVLFFIKLNGYDTLLGQVMIQIYFFILVIF